MMVNITALMSATPGAQIAQSGTDAALGGDFTAALDRITQQLDPLLQDGSAPPGSAQAAEDTANVDCELPGDIFDPLDNLPGDKLSDKQKEAADDGALPALAGMPVDERLVHLQTLVMQADASNAELAGRVAGAVQQGDMAAVANDGEGEGATAITQAALIPGKMVANSVNAAPTSVALAKQSASFTGPTGKDVKRDTQPMPDLPAPVQGEKPEQMGSLFKPVAEGAVAPVAEGQSSFTPASIAHTPTSFTSSPLSGHSTALPVAAPAPPVLTQEVGSAAWQQSLGQQIAVFTRNGIHNAEIRLNPAELGMLKINLRMDSDRANLHFVSDNHQVRAALEAALPQLRTSLAESGINLEASRVDGGSAQSWSGSSHSEWASGQTAQDEKRGRDMPQVDEDEVIIRPAQIRQNNGINTFV